MNDLQGLRDLLVRVDEKVKALVQANKDQDVKAGTFVTKEQLDIIIRSLEQKFLDRLTSLDRRLTEDKKANQWLQRAILGSLIASTIATAISLITGA